MTLVWFCFAPLNLLCGWIAISRVLQGISSRLGWGLGARISAVHFILEFKHYFVRFLNIIFYLV